jgi:hypothetical protein
LPDDANEHIESDIRLGDNTVMLKHCHAERSEASRLPAQQTLRFAQGDSVGVDFIIRSIF